MTDSADSGAFRTPGYGAADAAHMFEMFLERKIGPDAFADWLTHYPASGPGRDEQVANEIDTAELALSALKDGRRSWPEVHRELMDCRSRLTGLARL